MDKCPGIIISGQTITPDVLDTGQVFEKYKCTTVHVPQEMCHRRCATGDVPQEMCHSTCATGDVPQYMCHRRCATGDVPQEMHITK